MVGTHEALTTPPLQRRLPKEMGDKALCVTHQGARPPSFLTPSPWGDRMAPGPGGDRGAVSCFARMLSAENPGTPGVRPRDRNRVAPRNQGRAVWPS